MFLVLTGGPGNVLMDGWTEKINGTPYDHDGMWARSGKVSEKLLALLKKEAFFDLTPPKSTGRELFNLGWLESKLSDESVEDVQRTLVALTAGTITEAIERFALDIQELFVCGGGAKNSLLMQELAANESRKGGKNDRCSGHGRSGRGRRGLCLARKTIR